MKFVGLPLVPKFLKVTPYETNFRGVNKAAVHIPVYILTLILKFVGAESVEICVVSC